MSNDLGSFWRTTALSVWSEDRNVGVGGDSLKVFLTRKFKYVAHKLHLPILFPGQAVLIECCIFLLSPDAVSESNPTHSEMLPHPCTLPRRLESNSIPGRAAIGRSQKPGSRVSAHMVPQQPNLGLGARFCHQPLSAPVPPQVGARQPASQGPSSENVIWAPPAIPESNRQSPSE